MLKNVLSLLLSRFYSKQESELVGHQAMPSPSNTLITPSIKTECTTWSDAHIGIAPADGYLYVTGRTTNTDGFLQISSDTTQIAATTFGNTDKDIRLLFPFAKGQAMKVTAKSLKNIFLRFSSSIGGGYQALKNALLQGGVLCRLKHLYSSLRRNSCRVKRNPFRHGIIQRIVEPNYSLSQERTMSSFLQQTASFKLFCAKILKGLDLALSHKGAVTAENAQELTHLIYQDGTRYSSLFKKGLRSSFLRLSLVPHQNVYFCLTKTNSAVGGASC